MDRNKNAPHADRFVIALYPYDNARTFICDDPFRDVDALANDVLTGDLSPIVTRAIEIDLAAGTSRDVTAELYATVAKMSRQSEYAPRADLADELDGRQLDYFHEDELDAADDYREHSTLNRAQQFGYRQGARW